MKRKAEKRHDNNNESKRKRVEVGVQVETLLPREIWMLILEKLNVGRLLPIACVCTTLRTMVIHVLQRHRDKVAAEVLWHFSLVGISHLSVYLEWHKLLQWTKEEIVDEHGACSVLDLQEEAGNLGVCQWLTRTFDLHSNPADHYETALHRAICFRQYEVCVWHCTTFGITKKHVLRSPCSIFEDALTYENVSILTWLQQHYDISKQDITRPYLLTTIDDEYGTHPLYGDSILKDVLASSSRMGSWKGCEWLWNTFQLSTHNVRIKDRNKYLQQALEKGHVEYCEWFYKACDIQPIHLLFHEPGQSSCLLQKAVEGGHLSSCTWMYEKTQFDVFLVRDRCLLHHGVQKGRIEVCDWLVKTFHLTQKDGLAALRKMSEGGCWEGYMWLCSVFSFPRREIAQIALHTRNAGHYCLAKNLLDYFQLTEANGYSYDHVA